MPIRVLILSLVLLLFHCEARKEYDYTPVLLQYLALDYVISQDPDRSSVYFSTVRNVGLEVAYEEGSEPYTGNFSGTLSLVPVWSVTENNLIHIFDERAYSVSVDVPSDLVDMTEIPNQNRTTWTIDQLLTLESAYRRKTSNFQAANFFIAFVGGRLEGSPSVVGVTISGAYELRSPAIFLFKEVVNGYQDISAPDKAKKAEQITVTHELAHALGLVNAGIPMKTYHQDSPHGNHCTNTLCGMYWSLSDTAVNSMNPASPNIFGDECIDDIRNYNP